MNEKIVKLKPACKDYLWGGRRLKDEYNKEIEGDILAESWELSCHPDGPSTIDSGKHKGMTLIEYIKQEGKAILGKNCEKFSDFPMLIKFIDAKQDLSVQVHPNNEYAKIHENEFGKTEVWYVVSCDEGAKLYFGVKEQIPKEEFAKRIADDTLLEVLNEVPVKKGDVFFIEAGTIHAIGKNMMIAEVQQNSNSTYRIYDFGRVDANGNKRELHVDKATDVSNLSPSRATEFADGHVAQCEYFTVDKLEVTEVAKGQVPNDSFLNILVLEGQGTIEVDDEQEQFKAGESFFLAAGTGEYFIKGDGEFLLSYIEDIN